MADGPEGAYLPPPPDDLESPNVVVLTMGTALHRIHDRRLAGDVFNHCRGAPTRFAPIQDRRGECVASLYAGSTLGAAIYETILHDVPVAGVGPRTVPLTQVHDRMHSVVTLQRDVRLASLRAPDLRKWGIARSMLIASPPTAYARTASWAKVVHDYFPHVEGLLWTSNQCDPDDAVMFFGDRVFPTDLAVVSSRDGRIDRSLQGDVRAAAARSGIYIST